MKTFFQIFLFLGFSLSFAQNVSDYTSVNIPENFGAKEFNKYDLKEQLIAGLKKKGYEIVENASAQNCNTLFSELVNTSSLFRNKVKIEFKDCNKNVVANFEGISFEKDFEVGYPDALKKALEKMPISKPTNHLLVTKNDDVKTNEPPSTNTKVTTGAEMYSNSSENFNKINLSATEFIFTKPNSSVPFAKFKESTKKGIYRVWLENGMQTLGYSESNKIIIEIPQNDGSFKREEFLEK